MCNRCSRRSWRARRELCGAEYGAVYRVRWRARALCCRDTLQSLRRSRRIATSYPCPLRERRTPLERVRGRLRCSNMSDIENDPHTTRRTGDAYRSPLAFGSLFGVPMLREGSAIGAIVSVASRGPGLFADERSRAAQDLRRSGGHRHRERPPVHGARGADRAS